MRVTVIAGYYPPEQSADTRLNQDLVESFAKRGIDVTLIVPFPSRGVDEKTKKIYLTKSYEKVSEKLEIYRVGRPTSYKQGLFARGFSFLIKSFELYRFAKRSNSDFYLIVSTPPTLGYVAALLANKKKVIYKLQDIFPDSLIHSKTLKDNNLLIQVLRRIEILVYKRVTRIITVSDDLKRTLLKRNVPEDKITVIYDWIDEKKCYPVQRENNFLYDKFGLDKSKFYILYAGNIGHLQNFNTFVKASEIIADKYPDIGFIIIGDGAWKSELMKLLNSHTHNNVFCFPLQPEKDIGFVYSLGDVGLVSLKRDITKIALPSKTWDIMSTARAVLCEIDLYSQLFHIVEDNGCGYCIAPNDVKGMVEAIIKLYKNRDETKRMGIRGRNYILNNLTIEAAIAKYVKVFEKELENNDEFI